MSLNKEDDIQVSVCVVTYNQENYIAECLESLVTQQTSFKFEIIVGEDCSTDNTRKIVQQYVEQYPDLVIPLFHENNVGAVENVKRVYKAARGKYIAHMDGDDMALPNKLQRQFDTLEANPDCNICSHNMENINKEGDIVEFQNWKYPAGIYTLFDLYHAMPFFAHSSKMFRNNIEKKQWDILFSNPKILDMDIHFLNLQNGNIIHINENLGQYRVNVGMSNVGRKVNPLLTEGAIRIFEKGLVFFSNDIEKTTKLKKLYADAMLRCAYNYAVYEGNVEGFRSFVKKSLVQSKLSVTQIGFLIISLFPCLTFPLLKARAKNRGL